MRACAAVFLLLANAAFVVFLSLDYLRFADNVQTETYYRYVVLSLLGPAALAVLLIALTAFVDLCRRRNPAAVTQVRFELAWLCVVIFLQYSVAVVFTTLYLLAFKCDTALDPTACRTVNLVTLAAGWGIPFTTFCYMIFFVIAARRIARLDSFVWHTPVRAVDWDGKMSSMDDARSIATFVNKEEAILTMKTNMLMPPKPFFLEGDKNRRNSAKSMKSETSVYSTDTFIPPDGSSIVRPAAPSAVGGLGKVRYFQATADP